MDSNIELSIEYSSTFSLAAQQNAYPLFRNIRVFCQANEIDGDNKYDLKPLRDIVVKLTVKPNFFATEEWHIDEIHPEQSILLQKRPLNIPYNVLFELTEEITVTATLTVCSSDDIGVIYCEKIIPITVLPANYWGGERRQPELLAAFVRPNGVYVESLVRQVTELLDKDGHGRSANGYQSGTREKPYMMAAALWNIIFSQKIAYVTPPASFAYQGQRIRLASDISTFKLGACLDTSLLFASCFELMGLNPVIALSQEHAFVGVWLINERFPMLTNDDPMDLRKRIDISDIVLFESTLVTNTNAVTFNQAITYARELISEERQDDFVYVIDIGQARAQKIKPLTSIEERPKENTSDTELSLSLPPAPILPPIQLDNQILTETPETRIDNWQRKLLDLSKRNSLLSLKERTVAIKLYCSDICLVEDKISSGANFRFIPAEDSPLNDRERSEETFRLQTGSSIHKEYALDQLDKNVLIVNMARKKLEQNSITLLRKTRNDLEEGGSNTLYLAVGLLSWKENPEDHKSYKAPLILIPVELVRSSARAAIKIHQLNDEAPIFNTTLIEFLNASHSIDLNKFRDELPEDENGIDVRSILNLVRSAIAEQPGFEVIEELMVASFSFAKYLMWKDLKDRVGDLKENLFVKHLIDNPQHAYMQDANFIDQYEVDKKIDLEKIFTPLNCDSSQLVAVEASGRSQDFVLEGPPGTGKSETIANIICHNIALGKKVLFVAEKMAALNVVYRRMEKVGLDHLCLELHSNKANKKAVIEQLRMATGKREGVSSDKWMESVRLLKDKRSGLNRFVEALHKKSNYGISVRGAIERDVFYEGKHTLSLNWPLESYPNSIESSDRVLQIICDKAKVAGLAYVEVVNLNTTQFRFLAARSWSNAWQSRVENFLVRYKSVLSKLNSSAKSLASNFNIDLQNNTISDTLRINYLVELIDLACLYPIGYIVANNSRELLNTLEQLCEKKRDFDHGLSSIGHNISPEKLADTPISEWLSVYAQSRTNWLRHFLAKIKINSAAKKLGYEKFNDMEILSSIDSIANLQEFISNMVQPFEEDNIWQGWDTTYASLAEASMRANSAHKALMNLLILVDDPGVVIAAIKSRLVDARGYLDSSNLITQKEEFKNNRNYYTEVICEAKQLDLHFSEDESLSEVILAIDDLANNAPKFKVWSEWLVAKDELQDHWLDALAVGLESGEIKPEDAEEQVTTAFCRWAAPQLIDDCYELRQFKVSRHEQLITEFRQIDAEVTKTTGAYIAAITASSMPDPYTRENSIELGVLARELQKKTRHKPIRALINDMGKSLLDLCPCIMMSPLSVAQFLPSDFNAFDLVVFDEASQMTTWDSVGAIARGRNVIVVGDPKQLPPTSFFSKSIDMDNPDEEDLESILDQALAARLPHLRLKGHYRSKHETLIAFSNSKYYENSLITYPSSNTKKTAITLQRVNGVYGRGKSRNNPIEAKAVVAEIVARLTDAKYSGQSIGVVTLNAEQQRTIEDLLDDARRQYPEIDHYFQSTANYDSVFVKNLESVQGDERDVIILSLGYGPTEQNGHDMSMYFGPLSKSGGERRLNVAITRAISEVLIFSSFDSAMLDLSRSSAVAVEHLKHYLEFAERGPSALAEQSTAKYGIDQFDSYFEQAVADALRAKGWNVQTQVGVSKFRVDLGIIHPDHPGVYLAGVECDGATYHSSPSARDRDRVRHIILEKLGWKLLRLWSTDYFQDPDGALSRIDSRLKFVLDDDRRKAEIQKAEESIHQESRVHVNVIDTRCDIDEDNSNGDHSKSTESVESKSISANYDHNRYYDNDYRHILINIAKDILKKKGGITIHELALDMANLHGLSRTSKKQLIHIHNLIEPWAGIKHYENHDTVVWISPENVADEISWRGLDAFGSERHWNEIPYPEARGLARLAIQQSPNNSVDFICNIFKLKRRHKSTLDEIQSWINDVRLSSPDY